MFQQIFTLILDVVVGLLTGACLLRLYMQRQRISFANPIGQFVFALTDWMILPLRKLVPPLGVWDVASLVAALLVQLLQYLLLALVMGVGVGGWTWLPWLAVFGMARVALSGMIGLIIVYAVISWLQSQSPLADVIARLAAPVLKPFRRFIPLVGGIDLSPLAALLLMQVLMIVLGHLQASVLGAGF
ncbi:MAG: YggT family protein [Burkholderiaceae bacterium]